MLLQFKRASIYDEGITEWLWIARILCIIYYYLCLFESFWNCYL